MTNMPNGYFDTDISDMEKALVFDDLVPIAFRVIFRLGPPVGMVCGPITSGGTKSVKRNLEIIQVNIDILRRANQKIFVQLPFEKSLWRISQNQESGGSRLLEAFYLPILESGTVKTLYFIPNWKSSFGTNWEHEQALRLDMDIVYL